MKGGEKLVTVISSEISYTEVPDAKEGNKAEDGGLFASFLKPDTAEPPAEGKTGTEKSKKASDNEQDTEGANENGLPWTIFLADLCRIAGLGEPQAGASEEENMASAMEIITGILEGNGSSSDKDIASLLTEVKNSIEKLDSGAEEEIMARMPQLNELLQELGYSAKENIKTAEQINSYLCPLENISDHGENIETKPGTDLKAMNEQIARTGETTGPELAKDDFVVLTVDSTAGADGKEAKAEGTLLNSEAEVSETAPVRMIPDGECSGQLCDEDSEETDVSSGRTDNLRDVSATDQAMDESFQPLAVQTGSSQTSAAAETAAENALSRITDAIFSYDQAGDSRFELQLEPENLGKLTISLSMNEQGIKALISTKDAQIHSILASEITEVVNKLTESGVNIKSVDVVCTDMSGFESQHSGKGYSGEQAFSYDGKSIEDVQTAYGESDSIAYAWALGEEIIGSTVMYRA